MRVYVPRAVMIDGREVEALVPIEAVTITRQTELCKPGRTIRYIADVEEVPPAQD